jgi:hypothetical protein
MAVDGLTACAATLPRQAADAIVRRLAWNVTAMPAHASV